jgi:hypothetical protein
MAERKPLATINYITDFETSMYHMGEVDGSFSEAQLEDYIKRFGTKDLLEHLAYLTFQVIEISRKVNSEDDCSVAQKEI